MYSTSHPFFHAERENQPDFEDQHRTTWHLNSEIPVQRTKKYFDAAEHVLAIGTALSPSAIPWICNENEDGLVWSPAGAHLSSVKYQNIFLLEIGRWLSFKLQRGEQLSSFLHSLSCLSIWFRLSSGHAAVTHFSCLSETHPQFKCLAWDPLMTFVRLHYEPDLSLYTWELSLALKKALQKPRDGHYDASGCNKPLYIEDTILPVANALQLEKG